MKHARMGTRIADMNHTRNECVTRAINIWYGRSVGRLGLITKVSCICGWGDWGGGEGGGLGRTGLYFCLCRLCKFDIVQYAAFKNVDTAAVVYGALGDEVACLSLSLSLLLCLSLAVHLSGSEGVSVSRRCCLRIGILVCVVVNHSSYYY